MFPVRPYLWLVVKIVEVSFITPLWLFAQNKDETKLLASRLTHRRS